MGIMLESDYSRIERIHHLNLAEEIFLLESDYSRIESYL